METAGTGPPLVLCHGGPGLWDYLGPVAGMVDDLVTVTRYDQRGGGRSPSGGPITLDGFLTDLDDIREDMGHERLLVGGHSWGASLALFYALRHPTRVSGLVYLSGTGVGRSWKPSYDARVERLSGADRSRFLALQEQLQLTAEEEWEQTLLHMLCDLGLRSRRREVAEQMVDRRFRIAQEVNAALNAEVRALKEDALAASCRGLEVPVLVVAGAEDPRPPFAVDSLVAALPQAELVVMPGVGHLPWLEDPAGLRDVLRRFISRLVASP